MRDIASGKAQLGARQKGASLRQLVEAAVPDEPMDEVQLFDDDVPLQRFEFVDGDDEGSLQSPPRTVQKEASPPVARRVKQFKTGIDKKNKDLFVENPKGKMYNASDGVIKINLAKIIMRPVTEEEVAARKYYDGRNKLIDMACYRCLLPRSSNTKNADQHHPQFLHVGKYSGNITTHCNQYHDAVLQALARIIEETPKEEAKYKCEQYIAQLAAPVAFGGIDAWAKGASDGDVSNELLCLIWFLDANIAFVQFDNPFFRQLIKSLGKRTFPSSTTMVEKWLPALYSFAVKEMVGFLQRCRSFFTSFDGWSRFGQRFLSQSYHCIDPKAFEYRILPLDFISCQTPHWSEVIAGCLVERQEHWTGGLDPEPIAAGGIADGASDVQKAGKLAYGAAEEGGDMFGCQNHKLKGAYEVLERESPAFKAAIEAVAALFVAVSNAANVSESLRAFQNVNDLSSAALYVYNETRWEGRVRLLECALKLRQSLPSLKGFADGHAIGTTCDGFLSERFFDQLVVYHKYLDMVDDVSKLFQTQVFPTGHLVLLSYLALADSLLPSPDLAPFEKDFRAAVRKAVCETLVVPITSGANAFVKAALFHPDICRLLQHGGLDEDVFRLCVESVREDIASLSGEGTAVTKLSSIIFDTYLDECKLRDAAVFPGFAMLKKSGLYGTTDAMSFWRSIANETGNPFQSLLPVAAMLLALPAGESHNEFVFSASGRVLTRDRNQLSHVRLEQITVLVMFIRNFGWSHTQMMSWLRGTLAKVSKGLN
jgi:hypothetical protein